MNRELSTTILFFILANVCFLIFAYDIENDRDFFTWVWLLSAINWWLTYLIKIISTLIENND